MIQIVRPLLVAALLSAMTAHAQQPININTNQGPVTGLQTTTLQTFFGIPYAAPPTGSQRWSAPQPVTPWTVPRDATAFGNQCTQVVLGLFAVPGETKGEVRGAEDCLFLNVYTPTETTGRLPVMVWIHGGGFTAGAGSLYDGSVLARKHGVVVVTLNYRLGPLGFLALAGLNSGEGNYGLLDQQAALRWVRENIAAFGGDPGNVTVFGESAGGLSICAQLASPQATGLFDKVIIQSGLCMSPGNNVSLTDASRRNLAYAARLGCRKADSLCLRRVTPQQVTSTAVPGLRPLGNLVWSPVYGTTLLPLPLQAAFSSGKFHRVPVLQGTNHDEGRLFVSLASSAGKPLQPQQYWGGTSLLVGLAKNRQVLAQYPYKTYGTPALAFATVFTDAMFSCPALNVGTALAKYVPVYAFEFNDPQAVTSLKIPAGLSSLGSFHSSSLVYAFQTPLVGLADPAQFNPAQRKLSDAFSLAWVTFAKTGDPNRPGEPRWRTFNAGSNIQTFTPTGIAENTRFAEEHKCRFWSQLGLK
ncbi:carboxylesterase/lipase family protein [Candidatus Cyanaurora vandensis]|uniref:carboxylesterase/lipase family protein n=1 Tax=Candidatus Cyanaurora vandensis TaxID=2714958 RepID=UPI0025803163|nr:carboxylesterase family protein [Candidatus Cyanaurora vandensis]